MQNNTYASIEEILLKYESSDILSCIYSGRDSVGLEVFGFIPQNTNAYLDDSFIGVLDAPWLGVLPTSLNPVIDKIKTTIRNNTAHLKHNTNIIDALMKNWKLIKGLTMGMAMGVHRIIGTVGHTTEQELRAKYDLEQFTFKEIKAKTSPGKTDTSAKGITNIKSTSQTCTACNITLETNTNASQLKRDCAGITCNVNKVNWTIFKNFRTPNKISTQIKHCTRCARQSSALRLAAQIINEFRKDSASTQTRQFVKLIQSSSCDKISYRPLMNLLHPHYSKHRRNNEAKYIRKKAITDANKLVCRAIVQAHILETSPNITMLEKLQGMYNRLQATLDRSEIGANFGRTNFRQTKVILDTILQKRKRDQIEINLPIVDEHQREHYTREALTNNGLLSSMGVRRAIEVFRNHSTENCYFANAEARNILEDWNATQGWERAARMFGSHEVLCNKPDGFYFIPLFDGDERFGHWTVIIVRKLGRHKWGHVCDSLGTSSCTGRIHTKIKELFQGPKDRFDWKECTARQQSEVECGPRIIVAIHNAIESIRRNDPVETVILEATLMKRAEEEYDAKQIREKAANIISRFLPSMWTNPIRVNRDRATGRTLTNTTDEGSPRKKRRRKKKQKKSIQNSPSVTPIIVQSE